MQEMADGLGDKPNLEYFTVLSLFNGVWFLDCNEYWSPDCDFEMLRTNHRLVKTIVG